MARADLLLDLVEAERCGDRDRFRVLVSGEHGEPVRVGLHCVPSFFLCRLRAELPSGASSGCRS